MNKCFVDYRISKEEISNLSLKNLDIIKVLPSKNLYKAIDGHPDIQLNILSNNTLIAHEELFNNLKSYPSLNLVKAKTNLIWESKNLLPDETPARNGYQLSGWFYHDVEVSNDISYSDLVVDDNIKEIELIAKWDMKHNYTVKYDTKGGKLIKYLPLYSAISRYE